MYVWVMKHQSLEINYHTAPNNKSTALPILQKFISIMVCLLGRAEYIFIVDLTPGFNGLGKDNSKTRQEIFKFWDLIRFIIKVWQ